MDGFHLEVGKSIVDSITQIATFPRMEGFDVGEMTLTWEFEDERIPSEIHGEWIVTIRKGE